MKLQDPARTTVDHTLMADSLSNQSQPPFDSLSYPEQIKCWFGTSPTRIYLSGGAGHTEIVVTETLIHHLHGTITKLAGLSPAGSL